MGPTAAVRAGDDTRVLSSGEEQLWHQCVEQIDDDEPRHVLADLLQSAGDPRGELMTLQLMPADPENAPARRARIRELVARHRADWLGALTDIVDGASFDRGMLARIEMSISHGSAWRNPGPHDLELATVQEVLPLVLFPPGREDHHRKEHRALLGDPRLVSLRAAVDDGTLDSLPQRLRHVVVTGWQRLQYAATHDHVESVAVDLATFRELARQPWFERLRSVTIATAIRNGLSFVPMLRPHMAVVLCSRLELDTCEQRAPHDARLELLPDGTARVSGEWLLQSTDVLSELPATYTRLEIEDSSEPIVDRIRRSVEPRMTVTLRGLIGRAGNTRWVNRRRAVGEPF